MTINGYVLSPFMKDWVFGYVESRLQISDSNPRTLTNQVTSEAAEAMALYYEVLDIVGCFLDFQLNP